MALLSRMSQIDELEIKGPARFTFIGDHRNCVEMGELNLDKLNAAAVVSLYNLDSLKVRACGEGVVVVVVVVVLSLAHR